MQEKSVIFLSKFVVRMHKSGKGHSRSLRIISKPAGFSWQTSRAVSTHTRSPAAHPAQADRPGTGTWGGIHCHVESPVCWARCPPAVFEQESRRAAGEHQGTWITLAATVGPFFHTTKYEWIYHTRLRPFCQRFSRVWGTTRGE